MKRIFYFKKKLNKRIIITFFSSHKNEETILIECFKYLKKEFQKLIVYYNSTTLKNSLNIKENLKK